MKKFIQDCKCFAMHAKDDLMGYSVMALTFTIAGLLIGWMATCL